MDTAERTAVVETSSEYDGFISYSHAADDLLAPRLQSGLQRFAKPWWKRRALRIFRDESSLSANPHLWSSITEALDSSAWFVLLLSPDAAASPWVNQEIGYWQEHKDPSRILPVLTDGTFEWAAGDVSGTAVPEQLQGAFTEEPRWVDMRFARDEIDLDLQNPEFSNAVADVASAIRSVPKDELASEEVRQHRRTIRTAWAAAALVGALAVASTVFAIQASTERERAEAEATRANQEADRAEANAEAEARARTEAETNAELALQNEQLAESRELAASAIAQVDTDPALATWLALLALERAPEGSSRPVEVESALWASVMANNLVDSVQVGPPGNTFLDLSPDGSLLAVSSSETATLELRSADTLGVIWRFTENTQDGFSKPEFSPDGRLVALPIVGSGADDPWRDGAEDELPNRVLILKADSGEVSTTLEFPDCESVDGATWSSTGEMLVVGTGPGGCERPGLQQSTWVEVFDTSSWESLAVLDWEGDDYAVRPLFIPAPETDQEDSDAPVLDVLAVFPTHSAPRIYETDSFTLIQVLDDVGASVPAGVSAEGGLIAIFSNDVLTARLHDLATGQQLDVLGELEAWPSPPFGLTFSPNGRLLAAATGSRILLWDLESGEQSLRLTGGGGAVNTRFAPDGSALYSAHYDGTVKLWTLNPGGAALEQVEVLDTATFINGNTFSEGQDIGSMERIEFEPFGRFAQFFSAETGEFVGAPVPHIGGGAQALPNDRFLIGVGDEEWQWQVYDPETGATVDVGRPCPAEECDAHVSSLGAEVGIAYDSDEGGSSWQTYDAETLEPRDTFSGGKNPQAFSDEWVLESIGEQGGAFFFMDRVTGEELLRVPIPPIHFEVSNTGDVVALSGREGPIHIVDTAGWETRVLDLGIGRRRGMSFSPDDSLLAVGDEDELLIIDIERNQVVREVPVPLVSDVFWFDQTRILLGTREGLWARLSLDFGDLRARAIESLAVRPLTEQECTTYRIEPCPTLEDLETD